MGAPSLKTTILGFSFAGALFAQSTVAAAIAGCALMLCGALALAGALLKAGGYLEVAQ